MRQLSILALLAGLLLSTDVAHAQQIASPRGEAATQLGDFESGKWIVVDYGRPILRGRTGIFGEGETRGATVTGGAPVWRAGANKSTRLLTEADLQFGDQTLPAGEYSLFVELSQDATTLIISSHDAKESGREPGDGLWGSYNYTDDKDVVRTEMSVKQTDRSLDQFTIGFVDVTETGGTLVLMWDTAAMMAPFTVAE